MNLICQACGSRGILAEFQLRCEACGQSFTRRNSLVRVSESSDYWGEIDQAAMRDLLRRVGPAVDNVEDLKQIVRVSANVVYNYAFNRQRGDILTVVPVEGGTVLDIGAGWGTISSYAAEVARDVVSIEKVTERAEFVAIRAQAERKQNWIVLQDNITSLRFAPPEAAVIVLNGVLEWIPNGVKNGIPRDAQVTLLRRLNKLLATSGSVLVGIENRFSAHYMAGLYVDHSGLRFTSLMPRPVADVYCKLRLGKGYRSYTYTLRGYQDIAREAGFERVDSFIVYPSYSNPVLIVRAGSGAQEAIRYYFRALRAPANYTGTSERTLYMLRRRIFRAQAGVSEFIIRLANELGGLNAFAPAYLLRLSQKSGSQLSRFEKVEQAMQAKHGPAIYIAQYSVPFASRLSWFVFRPDSANPIDTVTAPRFGV